MSKWEFNSKVFLQQLIAYFFLLNGLKLLLSLRNIDLLKVLNNGSSLQVTIAEVQVLYPNRVPGMIISDFIFFNTIVSYCITIIIFLLLLFFSKSKFHLPWTIIHSNRISKSCWHIHVCMSFIKTNVGAINPVAI